MADLNAFLQGLTDDNSEAGVSFSQPNRLITNVPELRDAAQGEVTWIEPQEAPSEAPIPIKDTIHLEGAAADLERLLAIEEAQQAETRGYRPNTVSGQGAKLTPSPIESPTPIVKPVQGLMDEINSKLKDASEVTDTLKAASLIGDVKGAIAREAAKFQKETRSIAAAEFGVPSLEATLQNSVLLDDQSPGYRQKYGTADSDETAKVRSQLMQAKAAADSSINERLAGNSNYQELMNKAKATETMLTHRISKNIDIDTKRQLEAEEFYYTRPPEQRKLMDEILGNTQGDPRVAAANMKVLQANPEMKKQFSQVLENPETLIPSLALSGNVFAKRVLLERESKVAGPEVAQKKLKQLEDISKDNIAALSVFSEMKAAGAYPKGAEFEALEKRLKTSLGPAGGTSKQDQEIAAQARRDIAVKAARYITEKEFNSDIMALRNKASFPPPDWLQAAAASGKVGKIDKGAAIALVNMAPTVEERRIRQAELTAYYDSAVKQQNTSMIFQVSPLSTEQMKAEITLSGVLGNALTRVGNLLPSFGAPEMSGTRLQEYMKQSAER